MHKHTIAVTLLGVLLLAVLPAGAQMDTLLNVATNDMGTTFITGPDGMTLYSFAPDDANCTGACLENWPPLYVESEDELTKAEDIPGTLGTYERDGQLQVTYNGMPLYYWVQDEAPGDMTGDGVRGIWSIVEPVMLYVGGNDELGSFIVGPNGYTLYEFTPDDANCTGQCLENWPPLYVESEDDITVSRDLPGEVGVYERDGQLQVTYNGMPLYYWVNDVVVGDATGQNVNDVWFVVPPETVVLGGNDELGEFLVGSRGMTLYQFMADDAECTGQCLENWPPLTVSANDQLVAGEGVPGELGTFEREMEDGSTLLQVTYNGMPLYYWVNDEAPGDATGQGVNDVWFVVPPTAE